MFQKIALMLITVLLAGILVVSAQDESETETIKVDTRLVSFPVIVTDGNHRYIPGLAATDFTITQNGVPQPIEFFGAAEEPLTIALLIDTSLSTQAVLDDIKSSANSFIKLLLPQDKAMIVSFDYDTHILSELTSDQDQLRRAVKSAEIPDAIGTNLRDALYRTIRRSLAGITGRKAVILLTDGKDAGSRTRESELMKELESTDTLVYTIMFSTGKAPFMVRLPGGRNAGGPRRNDDRRPFPVGRRTERGKERLKRMNEEAEAALTEISDKTGGRFYARKDGKLKTTFELIVDELRRQYRIGFYPKDEPEPGVFYEVKITVARADAIIRARNGYLVQR